MPIYVYEITEEGPARGQRFEVQQQMKEPPLAFHPETLQPVRRVYLPPNLATRYTPGAFKQKIEKKNLEQHGFTRYERDKLTGRYHKTAGKDSRAPSTIDPRHVSA